MKFRLDDNAETQNAGDTLLRTERDFLEAIAATPPATFLVQGIALCHWVTEWCDGRDIRFETVASPRATWRALHPAWTDGEIAFLQNKAGVVLCPPTVEDALGMLFPDLPFSGHPCENHAAQWLMWLDAAGVADADPSRPLLRSIAETWRVACDEGNLPEQSAYRVSSSDDAQTMLHDWLLEGRFGVVFPRPIPPKWQDLARGVWKYGPIEQGAESFWRGMVAGTFHADLLKVAALLTDEYLACHPERITQELVRGLREHLPPSSGQRLQSTCPPPQPGDVPPGSSPADVLMWFKDNYLPFRRWQVLFGSIDHADHIKRVAHSFATWLLDFYPRAVAGGSGYDVLAIAESARLQRASGVTLWVILDGMPVPDGEILLGLLRAEGRFTLVADQLCFSTLPTITCFCKPALMNGRPPETLPLGETPTPNFPGAVLLKDKTMRDQAAAAENGQVLVLSHKDPDGIYHRNQSRETTAAEVSGQLNLLATRIREIAFAVPPECDLSLVVSTDHGRLLSGDVPRYYAAPGGLTPEGRAAWGTCDVPPPPGVVALDAERFRLPQGVTAWVVHDESAFVQTNGGGGTVAFPHGGLWPEEVITPWFALVRDAPVPMLRITVEASGRSGGVGRCTATLDNAGLSTLTVTSLRLTDATASWVWEVRDSITVPAQTREIFEREIAPYPGADILAGVFTGEAMVLLAGGVTLPIPATVSMKADTLYQRGLDARDLLDL